jgi:hypothetical protein
MADPLLDDPDVRCDIFTNHVTGGAVRLTHVTSGIVATYEYGPGESQLEAKERAAALLRLRMPFPDPPADGYVLTSPGRGDGTWTPGPVIPAGWQCPRCEKVHAPSVLSCPCSDSLRDRIGRGSRTGMA